MKLRFASAYAAAAAWDEAVEQVLRQLPRLRIAGANLGFLYFSDRFAPFLPQVLTRLRRATGVERWTGASGVGVLSDHGAALDAPGLSVLLGRFPENSFQIFSGRQPLPRDFAAYGAIVHADPATPDMPELVQDMAGKIRAGTVAGGLASARGTAWQVADDVLTGGLSGVAFGQAVRQVTGVAQGCTPLPGHFCVTSARDNLIETLNTLPALEVFREVAGPVLGADLKRAVRNVLVGLADSADDRRLYQVRRVVSIDVQRGRLFLNDPIEPGQHLIFVRQDETSAHDDLKRMLAELHAACPTPPKGGIYVSCLSRGGTMFERDETELEMIAEVFGDLPVAGFFAAGEIAGNRLFGYTGTLTLFL